MKMQKSKVRSVHRSHVNGTSRARNLIDVKLDKIAKRNKKIFKHFLNK